MTHYILECGDFKKVFPSFREAVAHALGECNGLVKIYRAEPILVLSPDELASLRELLTSRGVVVEGEEAEHRGTCVAAIFDQMFRGFAEIVDRELREYCIELHEVVGRGLEKTVRVGRRIYREPAHDDYDVLSLAERLAKRMKVVLFTGDKKLAEQASMLRNVHVEYMPPSEYTGKEMAVKHMISVLRRLVEG